MSSSKFQICSNNNETPLAQQIHTLVMICAPLQTLVDKTRQRDTQRLLTGYPRLAPVLKTIFHQRVISYT